MAEPWLTVSMLVVAFFAAVLSGSAGFGGAMLLLPILTWELGPERAIPLLAIAQLASNASRAALSAPSIAWKPVVAYSAGALPLTLAGAMLLTLTPPTWLRVGIGLFVFGLALSRLVRSRRGDPGVVEGRELDTVGLALRGGGTGFVSALAGTAGPLGNAVFLGLRLTPTAYVASEAAATCVIHATKLVVFGQASLIATADLPRGIGLAVAMVLGTFYGKRLIDDVPRERFIGPVNALMLVAGVAMIAQGAHLMTYVGDDVAPE